MCKKEHDAALERSGVERSEKQQNELAMRLLMAMLWWHTRLMYWQG